MFNPRKPIKMTQVEIDEVIIIKTQIAIEMEWYTWNKDLEWDRLFWLKVSQSKHLKNLNNTL